MKCTQFTDVISRIFILTYASHISTSLLAGKALMSQVCYFIKKDLYLLSDLQHICDMQFGFSD